MHSQSDALAFRLKSSPQYFFLLFSLLCLLASLATTGCGGTPAVALQAPPPPEITVAHPAEKELLDFDEYTGRTEAVEVVEIRARVSGFLEKFHFTDGALVNKGDTLFTIDPRPYEADLNRAKGDLDRLQAKKSRLDKDMERISKLIETNAASRQEFDKITGDRAEATGEIAAAAAAVQRAELDRSFTVVTAPISGRIGRHMVSEGNLITAGGAMGPGTLLTTIVSLHPMHVYCDCSEQNMLKYQKLARDGKRKGARETRVAMFIGLANETGAPHEGYIDFIDNRVDPSTGTIRARGIFENKEEFLTPGLFVRIRVPGSGNYPAKLIPERAISSSQGQKFVYVLSEENKVTEKSVKTGTLHDGFRVIEEGLTSQDRVVINAMAKVRPGMPVSPKLVSLEIPTSVGASSPTAPPPPEIP